jgi:propionyl-CoA synthetase
VSIVDDHNELVTAPNTLGRVAIKLPMPPSFMLTLWGHDEAFIKKYLSDTPGHYTTGDAGLIDERGYLHIMTRVDDVINTAGHRLSTGRLEEVINEHPSVVESAVVGHFDEIRGDCPVAFVILKGKDGLLDKETRASLIREINEKVRHDVGPIARLEGVIFVQRLPKTRSGKILRGTMRKFVNGETEVKMPATIDDTSTIDHIK